ncbi:unnamed protein product [Vicia faba]|uniref:DUF4283 domain-containing protein n=1 Tax=Vicia faba TaxID=3906 RepID=A0AAV1A0S6_VICFA|nr:unnamed protein product [Vicia faba]
METFSSLKEGRGGMTTTVDEVSEEEQVSGEEKPSGLDMHFNSFWVRVYDLPSILILEAMTRKIESILGTFEEMNPKDEHMCGRFLHIKIMVDLKKPLKEGQWLGHYLKDCEALGDLSDEGYEDVDEHKLSYAKPLGKVITTYVPVSKSITLIKEKPKGRNKVVKNWGKKATNERIKKLEVEKERRKLVDVKIMEASSEKVGCLGKKRRQDSDLHIDGKMIPEVVLDAQHCLSQ